MAFAVRESISVMSVLTIDMKHKYGYMKVPGGGFYAVPPDLFTLRDRKIIKLFNEAVICESPLFFD